MQPAFIYIALAIVASATKKILDRFVAVRTSVYSFAIVTQFLAALLFLPFAWNSLAFPTSNAAWLALAAGCAVWMVMSLTVYLSIKKAEVSIKEPLHQSKLIWTLLFGMIFLGEVFTTQKLIGTAIIFVGMTVAVFHPERKLGRFLEPDVLWTLFHALLGAAAVIIDKHALTYFAPETYGFIVYLVPGIVLLSALPKKYPEVTHLLKFTGMPAIITITLATATYFLALKAYQLADATLVYPLLQLGTVIAVLLSMFLFGEKEHRAQKVIGLICVLIGAIVLKFA